jgi:hypothetical protein
LRLETDAASFPNGDTRRILLKAIELNRIVTKTHDQILIVIAYQYSLDASTGVDKLMLEIKGRSVPQFDGGRA